MHDFFDKVSGVAIVGVMLSDTDNQNIGFVIKPKTNTSNPIDIAKNLFSGDKYLLINKEWYLEHRDDCERIINAIIHNSSNEAFTICDNLLFFPSVIDSLCENQKIKSIDLGSMIDGHVLSKEEYEKLKKSGKTSIYIFDVDDVLMNIDDSLIQHSDIKLIDDYRYSDFIDESGKDIKLRKLLTNQEIEYLKFISDNKPIILCDECIFQTDKVCKRLCLLNKHNQVIVEVNNKKIFNNYLFNNNLLNSISSYDSLFVKYESMTIDIKKCLEFEQMLYNMVKPAMHLSPFEKFLYAYNIVKHYKKYNENTQNPEDSRNIYKILDNEYIVCFGFSIFLGDLLDKLDISNYNLDILVDVSYDEIKLGEEEITPKEKNIQYEAHSRRYVYLVDKKYGIDGFFNSDATWDNSLDKDLYNFAVMTDEEVTMARRYIKISTTSIQELFNIHNLEEFYFKVNFLLQHQDDKLTAIYSDVRKIAFDIIERLTILDNQFIYSLKKLYPYIDSNVNNYPDNVDDLLERLVKYIIKRVNKEVSGETIIQAVENLYRELYIFPEERIDIELEKIISDNRERQIKCFPPRHRYYVDGRVEKDSNWHNKFAFDAYKKIM